ncbi:glycosyltransferase [Streptomyces fulvorobeus]|uniref:Glycosyltransferase involved in cell wall biosynthesis/putative flippase GtrA n=1 Tax=Streptomyces fulvorobeus TaxID=284028 RepID=A0A7J0CGT0_9ACTN|nr:glycosyltransferase [Streptomyces fulvorobeus]NYE44391.1 glycosyltransferase involved in cell wall biosynthesis/putative flippase GtrA [Streptomyces fulvorobeus]GFN00917.1 sugar transferase [Streptomyces fulvorobeus]
MTALQLSVVVPCFNEAEAIETFHAALLAALEPLGEALEVCYVDDGSTDGTRLLLGGLAALDTRVRYTAFSRNFGKEAAMLAGLRMSKGAAVVLMDADLQHPPELIPRMLELHRHGYDQVIPRRDRTGDGMLRTALSHTYYALVRRCMDVEVVDGSGDFRLLSRRAVDSVLSLPESNRFSKGIFSWIGFDTVSFRYRNRERAAGQSKWGSRRLLNYGIDGLLSFNNRPLRLAIYTGFWVFVSALVYALWTIVNVALNGAETPGYATLLTAVVALSGIQLVTLGVIGEYVGRIYHEAKHRPPYVVRETDESCPVRPGAPKPVLPGELSELAAGRSHTMRQFASFVLIGFVNTAVYLAVYVLLNQWIPYLLAHAAGFTVSVIGSFLLNSYITVGTAPTWRGLARYPLSSVVNLLASGALLHYAVSVLDMDKNVAALVAGVLVTPVSFLLARWAITSGRRTGAAAGRPDDTPSEPPMIKSDSR